MSWKGMRLLVASLFIFSGCSSLLPLAGSVVGGAASGGGFHVDFKVVGVDNSIKIEYPKDKAPDKSVIEKLVDYSRPNSKPKPKPTQTPKPVIVKSKPRTIVHGSPTPIPSPTPK